MIYETPSTSRSGSNNDSESEYPIGHCAVCNGSGTVGVLCQDFEDSGMIYEASTNSRRMIFEASATRNTKSEAESEAADQTGHCPDCNRSISVGDNCDVCNSTYLNFLAGR